MSDDLPTPIECKEAIQGQLEHLEKYVNGGYVRSATSQARMIMGMCEAWERAVERKRDSEEDTPPKLVMGVSMAEYKAQRRAEGGYLI